MFKLNFQESEGLCVLASDRRKGLWAHSVCTRGGRVVRTAGQLRTEASTHTLLSLALASSLRNIPRRLRERLAVESNVRLPRFTLLSTDVEFLDSVMVLSRGQQPKQLRAGHQFRELVNKKLLQRYEFQMVTGVDAERDETVLRDWSRTTLLDPKKVAALEAILLPTVVSTIR